MYQNKYITYVVLSLGDRYFMYLGVLKFCLSKGCLEDIAVSDKAAFVPFTY